MNIYVSNGLAVVYFLAMLTVFEHLNWPNISHLSITGLPGQPGQQGIPGM